MNYENAYKLLEEKGQLHLLKYYDTLSEAEQAALLNQISEKKRVEYEEKY